MYWGTVGRGGIGYRFIFIYYLGNNSLSIIFIYYHIMFIFKNMPKGILNGDERFVTSVCAGAQTL